MLRVIAVRWRESPSSAMRKVISLQFPGKTRISELSFGSTIQRWPFLTHVPWLVPDIFLRGNLRLAPRVANTGNSFALLACSRPFSHFRELVFYTELYSSCKTFFASERKIFPQMFQQKKRNLHKKHTKEMTWKFLVFRI